MPPTKSKPAGRTLEQYAQDETQARYAENKEIARSNRALRAELEKRDKELAEVSEKLGLYERLDAAKADPPEWIAPRVPGKSHVAIPSMLVTDVHGDEVVRPEQIDYVNSYNPAIQEMRVRRAFKRAIHVTRDYLGGVEYEGFNLMLGGDMVSGIIHEELRETNAATVIESVLTMREQLAAGITLLRQEFGRVHVVAVVGNHGRNTKKPRAKYRVQDSFDWLIYRLLQRDFQQTEGVTMQVPAAADAHFHVYGTRYLLTHGDQFKGGSGIAGALSPLLLGVNRKTRRQARTGQPFDVVVMGHWHTSMWMPTRGLIVGGSVVGYNEYAYLANLDPEEPQCALWLNTPERGITISAPVFVSSRTDEGW